MSGANLANSMSEKISMVLGGGGPFTRGPLDFVYPVYPHETPLTRGCFHGWSVHDQLLEAILVDVSMAGVCMTSC